jgi:hypothetical protein
LIDAVIVQSPAARIVTCPFEATLATAESEELHETSPVRSFVDESVKTPVAVRLTEDPMVSAGFGDEMTTFDRAGLTTMSALLLALSNDAVTVDEPAARAVTRPELTLATEAFDVVQFKLDVISREEPSL